VGVAQAGVERAVRKAVAVILFCILQWLRLFVFSTIMV
jgi:hypothetical protein